VYNKLKFTIFTGTVGDSFDRYLIRMNEMRESLRIMFDCINQIPEGPIKTINAKLNFSTRNLMKQSMEFLISHFKLFTEGYTIPMSAGYTSVESPKGEFGVMLVTDGSNKPYRLRFRSPGFFHLQSLHVLGKRAYLADLVTLLGTIDIVFGEIDR
jgi:NADH:ubiquinone oxidoreductase subunit D